MMLIRVITDRTQIVIVTLSALPPNTVDGLLSTSVAHGSVMFYSSWSAIENSEKY